MNNTTAIQTIGQKMSSFSLTRFGKFPSLLMREYYENKTAFVIVPLVLAGLMALAWLSAMVVGDMHRISVEFDVNGVRGIQFMLERWESDDMQAFGLLLGAAGVAVATPIIMILPFVVIFPLLNSLYEERVERSYLFWKSMPVSDWMEVASKMVYICLLGPFVLFAIAALLNFVLLLLATPFMIAYKIPLVTAMWTHTPFISAWVGIAANYAVFVLWALPILAWFMLASSYAPKAPLLYATVPPAAIMILETIFTRGDSTLGRIIGDHFENFGRTMAPIYESSRQVFESGTSINQPTMMDAISGLGASLTQPGFWMGLAIAAAFLAGATYLRRYRV